MSTYGFTFTKEKTHKFVPSAEFAKVATQEEIDMVRCYPIINKVIMTKSFRGKSSVKKFIDAGFHVVQESKQYYTLNDQTIGSIKEEIIGPMIIIDKVEEKYSDNNGAYQLAIGRDKDNNVMTVANMYCPSAYFAIGLIPTNLIDDN
jgi:hypothetical protein